VAEPVVSTAEQSSARRGRQANDAVPPMTADGVAGVAVSLIHGCTLQAIIDPKGFDVRQHFDTAAQMLDRPVYEQRLGATG
jgi:hypothetical protein